VYPGLSGGLDVPHSTRSAREGVGSVSDVDADRSSPFGMSRD
jgi:hypothetical protein